MWNFETKLDRIITRAPDVLSFRYPIPIPNVRYRAGQYFYINILVQGKKAQHHFSFSSSPTEKGYIEFTKRITSSDFSKALQAARPGDPAWLEGPEGSFTLPTKQSKLAFLSGGIGITPMRSMMRYVKDKNLPLDIILLYGSKTGNDIVFRDELDELNKLDNIRIYYFLDNFTWEPVTARNKFEGRIDAVRIKQLIPDYRNRVFYFSGPPAMVTSLIKQVTGLGIKPARIKYDIFTGYK